MYWDWIDISIIPEIKRRPFHMTFPYGGCAIIFRTESFHIWQVVMNVHDQLEPLLHYHFLTASFQYYFYIKFPSKVQQILENDMHNKGN